MLTMTMMTIHRTRAVDLIEDVKRLPRLQQVSLHRVVVQAQGRHHLGGNLRPVLGVVDASRLPGKDAVEMDALCTIAVHKPACWCGVRVLL